MSTTAATTATSTLDALLQSIETRTATIGIIGLGYVGLPLVLLFEEGGFRTLGFDVDAEKKEKLNRGESYIRHIGVDRIAQAFRGRAKATTDFSRIAECDALIVCVPTPLGAHREPDLKYIRITAETISHSLRKGQIVVLESTTYPGTTREELLPRFEATGRRCGEDYFLAFSPEREDPGNEKFNTKNIPKVVGGMDAGSSRAAEALYGSIIDHVVPVSSPEVAESAKLLENIFRAVNIALVNEMKMVLDAMGIDVWEVVAAAKTKPFGFQAFYPGPGLGGHCIPIDPFYLTWKAREVNLPTRFIELAGEINHQMPQWVVQKTSLALNEHGRAVKGSKILVLGLAYKPDVDDVRESPSFELIELLEQLGAEVEYHDPHVPATHKMRHHDLQMRSIELTPESLKGYDCVLVATNHAAYDWQQIADHARLIVDTRNAMQHVKGRREHIVKA
jgi:UDP-N-acetyl-D-glucosamine dehydrogenase